MYRITERLNGLLYQNAKLVLKSFVGNTLVLTVTDALLRMEDRQNPSGRDRHTSPVTVTFTNFKPLYYYGVPRLQEDGKGGYLPLPPESKPEGTEALPFILDALRTPVDLFCFTLLEDTRCCIEGTSTDPCFRLEFTFDHVTSEWQALTEPSWDYL